MTRYYQRSSPSWIPINTRVKVAKLLYNDNDGVEIFSPTAHLYMAHVLLDTLAEHLSGAVGVVGIGVTGYPLASAIAFLSIMSNVHNINALYLNDSCVAGKLNSKEDGLVLLDRDVHSGKRIIKAIKILRSLRYKVLGAIVLVDYQEGASQALKKKKIPFYSVFTREEVITEVDEWNSSISS